MLADGPLTAGELAPRAGVDAGALHRLLRSLASYGVFTELESQRFALNDAADCLRADADPSLRDLVLYYGAEPQQAWSELMYSVKTGKPAFDHVFGQTVWQFFEQDAEAARVFNGAMRGGAATRARILCSYPFQGGETVVDLGGGNGELLIDLLSHHAGLKGIVIDRPHVVAEAGDRIATAGLELRCTAVPGDLFSEIETVLSDACDADIAKLIDLHMLVETGGRERTEPEWRALLERSGFRLDRIFRGVPWCLLEAVPREDA